MIGDYWLLLGDHDWARVSAAAEGDGLSLAEYASRYLSCPSSPPVWKTILPVGPANLRARS